MPEAEMTNIAIRRQSPQDTVLRAMSFVAFVIRPAAGEWRGRLFSKPRLSGNAGGVTAG